MKKPERVAFEAGKIPLPQVIAEHLKVKEGDYLVIEADGDGKAALVSLAWIVERAHGAFKDVAPGRSLVDELLAERREEARREAEE